MRFTLRILSAILFTLAIALVLLVLLPGQQLANIAAARIEEQIGRKIYFDGDVRFSLWPNLGFSANDVTLENADWAGPAPLLSAARLTVGLDTRALLGGDVQIRELSAILPQINLATNQDGLGNWEFVSLTVASQTSQISQSGGTPQGAADTRALPLIDRLTLGGATIHYTAHGQAPMSFDQVDLALSWPEATAPLTYDLTLRPFGAPLRAAGTLAAPVAFFDGQGSGVETTLQAAGAQAQYRGQIALDTTLEGALRAEVADTAALLEALGQPAVLLPAGLGQAVNLNANITYGPGAPLSLRGLDAALDGNRFAGALDVTPVWPVQVSGRLETPHLDLTGLRAGKTEAAVQPSTAAATWSDEAIDASALALANGQLHLEAAKITAGDVTFGASTLDLTLDRARAVLLLQPLSAFGGEVTGELVANNRSGLSLAGKLTWQNLALAELSAAFGGEAELLGNALGQVNLLAEGQSQQALMASLTGDGWFEVGEGRYTGFDLARLMDPRGGTQGVTVFNRLRAGFDIQQGVAQSSDFEAQLPAVTVTAEGTVDLAARAMDMTAQPRLGRDGSAPEFAVPLRIHGAWDDLRFVPDLSNWIDPRLQDPAAQAEEALREKLSEELGTELESLEDAEEALRERIENQARDQLMQFLQGN